LNKIIAILLIINLAYVHNSVKKFEYFYEKLDNKIIYNLDLARQEFLDETRYAHMKGCLSAIENYEESKNNYMDWCSDRSDLMLEYFTDKIHMFGKKGTCN
jgi:hypothetical protein